MEQKILITYYKEIGDPMKPWHFADLAYAITGRYPTKISGVRLCKSKAGKFFISHPSRQYEQHGEKKEFRYVDAYSAIADGYIQAQDQRTADIIEAIKLYKASNTQSQPVVAQPQTQYTGMNIPF